MTLTKILGLIASLSLAACDPRPTQARDTVETRRFPNGSYDIARKRDGLVEGRVLTYSAAGDLLASQYYQHDTLHGSIYRLCADGQVFVREEARGGLLNGPSYVFTRHGRVGLTRHLVDGQRVGSYRTYYDGPPPNLREAIDFVRVAGEEHPNHYEAYDSLGHLLRRDGLLQLRAERDTVPVGDTLVLQLRVRYAQCPHLRAILGDYDDQFVLRDSTAYQVVAGRGNTLTLLLPPRQRGPAILRGCVENFSKGPRNVAGETTEAGQRIYFAYPYFVR